MSAAAAGEYRAPWWLPGGHLQTLAASLRPSPPIDWQRERWTTPDGDFIDVDFAGDAGGANVIALFHGLEGGSRSHYARALGHHLRANRSGWRLAVVHFRGCSGEPNRLARAYHSGDSVEIGWVLERMRESLGAASGRLHAVGISLGGNALLKWLGEAGDAGPALVHRAVAISAPLDLAAAGEALETGFARAVYAEHFLATLRRKALMKLERFPGLFDATRVQRARTLRDFDDAVTAPLHGFRDADDYWARSSSLPHLASIAVPTLVLNARNDPFLPGGVLDRARPSESVILEFPATGGHAGFLSGAFPGRHDWLPKRVLEFLDGR